MIRGPRSPSLTRGSCRTSPQAACSTTAWQRAATLVGPGADGAGSAIAGSRGKRAGTSFFPFCSSCPSCLHCPWILWRPGTAAHTCVRAGPASELSRADLRRREPLKRGSNVVARPRAGRDGDRPRGPSHDRPRCSASPPASVIISAIFPVHASRSAVRTSSDPWPTTPQRWDVPAGTSGALGPGTGDPSGTGPGRTSRAGPLGSTAVTAVFRFVPAGTPTVRDSALTCTKTRWRSSPERSSVAHQAPTDGRPVPQEVDEWRVGREELFDGDRAVRRGSTGPDETLQGSLGPLAYYDAVVAKLATSVTQDVSSPGAR